MCLLCMLSIHFQIIKLHSDKNINLTKIFSKKYEFFKNFTSAEKKFDLFSILEHYQCFQENAQNCVYYNYEVKNGLLKAVFKRLYLIWKLCAKRPKNLVKLYIYSYIYSYMTVFLKKDNVQNRERKKYSIC